MRFIRQAICFSLVLGFGLCLGLSGSAKDAVKPAGPASAQFSSVKINKNDGSPVPLSALDLHLDSKGKAIQFYVPPYNGVARPNPRTYFCGEGMMYTNGWVTISGVYSGDGAGYNIHPPTSDPSMLGVWSDVLGPAIQVRAANAGAESYIFQALDRKANYTFSVEQNGALQWGAASRKEMDTNLYRSAPKALKTDGSLVVSSKLGVGTSDPGSALHVKGSQSVQRIAVQTDYALTDTDYYVGVTDTAEPRTVTLPAASGREGRVYIIKDESGRAATRPITLKAQAGETIDGAESKAVNTNYGILRVVSSGTVWFGM